MATYETKGRLTYKDENSDNHIIYPVTKIDCIEDMPDIEKEVAESVAAYLEDNPVETPDITEQVERAEAAATAAEAAKESVSTSVNLAGGYASSASSSATRAEEAATRAEEAVASIPESGGGTVKTVNGVEPDENGNVEITIPDSGGNVEWLDPEQGEVFTSVVNTPDVPAPTLTGISATYTGGDVLIGTALSALVGIVVTAKHSDGTTKTVTDYTMSGSITEGSNTITVTYEGMTTTFTVTGVAEEPEVTLTSISATYTGGNVAVGTAVTDLTGITVTAHYSDGSTAPVTGYTLSGEIAEGSNTITVSYGGKTTTFVVTGEAEAEEDSGLTDEELEALDAMPDAYLSDDGEYIYWNPLRAAAANTPVFSSNIGEKYALCTFNVNKTPSLDSTGQNFFNGVIPFSAYGGGTEGFIKDETSPDICYQHRYGNVSDLDLRVGIEDYNEYLNNGNLTQLLYDKYRRLPMKTSDKMAVLEIDESYDANFTSLSVTPTVNEHGYYATFLIHSLGNNLGVSMSSVNVFCNYGGFMSDQPPADHEWFFVSRHTNRFNFSIPADQIAEPTFENIKNYIVNRGIKFFYAKTEVTE